MPGNIKLVTIGSEEQANKSIKGISINHRNVSTVNQFKEIVNTLHAWDFVVLLFLYPSNQILHAILEEARKREDQIIRVFVCGNLNNNAPNIPMNICFVSKLLVKYTIKSTIARFVDEYIRLNQHDSGKTEVIKGLYQQRSQIVEQFNENGKLKACHILLIPLNATPRNVHNAQQRLKNMCYRFYRNEYKFVIHTLYDYIPEDENNPDDQSYTGYLQKQYKGDICQTIMNLSFMRMYVVGNEPYISNGWSQKLVAMELDIAQDHAFKYVERCSFIINQPVAIQFTQDLVPRFGAAWQIQRAVAKTLTDVRDDIHFQDALPRIHGCLGNREMAINYTMQQRSLANSEDITRFSKEIHPIEQAQNCPEEKQVTGDIKSQIVSDR